MRWSIGACVVVIAIALGGCGQTATTEAGGDPKEAAPATTAGRPFCDVLADVNALYNHEVAFNVDSSMSSRESQRRVTSFLDELRTTLDRGDALLRELDASAPEEIAPQVRTLVDDGLRRSESLRRAGDDPFALADGWWPDSRTSAAAAAAGDIDSYAQANCGFSFRPDGR
ncbi:MAG TPA: hypothetical protein VM345_10440 [Acidimicrobiales bacterium]|jgi:hypothetical protein|nr:hypothetical protein [Acidimicrobiales bacterium]